MAKGSKSGFEKWLKTGQGKRCQKGFMMDQPAEYKINCLWWCYYAGARSGEISMTNPVAQIIEELRGRKTIPGYLQKKIEYVLQHKEDYTIENL